jgi:propionyl-CoA carboxylase alpha chain
VEGRLTTAFIPEEYPTGFHGVALTPDNKHHIAVGAAIMNAIRAFTSAEISGRTPHAELPDVTHVVVTLGGSLPVAPTSKDAAAPAAEAPEVYDVQLRVQDAPAGTSASEDAASAGGMWVADVQRVHGADGAHIGAPVTLRLTDVDWSADGPIMFAHLPDKAAEAARTRLPSVETLRLQHVERLPGDGFRLQLRGAIVDAYVRTPRAAELARHMLPKPKRDFSRVLVSPMPGTLVSVAVAAGDEVELGQELAVVEAMKMQNVLRSPKKGKVKAVPRKAGETLAVDQVIIEFD